jgi:DNA-binding PadR family transcriptional regulator
MDIANAILGLLSWQPFSGYDLKKIISESDLFYRSGNNNQIYNSLVQLHRNGLVTQEIQPQDNLPAKKVYTITAGGRAELARWASAEPELPELRHNFLIQLAWADLLPEAQIDDLLAKYEEELSIQLRMRQRARGLPRPFPDRSPREKFLWRQIDEHLSAAFERELDWVRKIRADIQAENFIPAGKEEQQ